MIAAADSYWPSQVVSRDIRTLLTQRAQYFNIVLDDVSITNLTFSREYTGAVEAKQVAQQDSERAKFIVSILTHTILSRDIRGWVVDFTANLHESKRKLCLPGGEG